MPGFHGTAYQGYERFTHGIIREPLAKVDGPMFLGKCTHNGEDGSSDLGQFGMYLRSQVIFFRKVKIGKKRSG
jgi:hypothetical protein